MSKLHQHIIHVQAASATISAILFAFAPNVAGNLLFVKGAAAVTPVLRALLVTYAGILMATAGAACSMRYTKETVMGLGFGQLVFGACCAWQAVLPITNPAMWAYAALNIAAGAYFAATASTFPSEAGKPKGPKSTHMKLMHANAGISGTMCLMFVFGRKQLAELLWVPGAAALTPEVDMTLLSLGVFAIITAGALCSIKVTKTTARGVGFGFLCLTAAEIWWLFEPSSWQTAFAKPVNYSFVLPFLVTGVYFIATSSRLPTSVETGAARANTNTTATEASRAPRETRKGK